jgi:predicted RNA binding protein YcfA (HicA-like mRNA interferase family)
MKFLPHENPARPLGPRSRQGALQTLGLRQVHQDGSHIILQTDKPSPQRIPVPDHSALRIGTLNSILRLVATHKGVDKQDVLATF